MGLDWIGILIGWGVEATMSAKLERVKDAIGFWTGAYTVTVDGRQIGVIFRDPGTRIWHREDGQDSAGLAFAGFSKVEAIEHCIRRPGAF